MTKNKDIAKEANKQAEKEKSEKLVKVIKEAILETLERLEAKKKAKQKIEDEIRILKKDVEDLREGKFEKLQERRKKSGVAAKVSVDIEKYFRTGVSISRSSCSGYYSGNQLTEYWLEVTSGTYPTSSRVYFY